MATKLERIGNYIILTDLVSGHLDEYPADDIYYRNDSDTIAFNHKFNRSLIHSYLWTDLVDKDGVAWASKDVLVGWLRENTGDVAHLTDGAIDVILQDPTTPVIIVPASQVTFETFLTVQSVKGSYDIIVNDGSGMDTGDLITIFNPDLDKVMFTHLDTINGNTITLNHPVDADYPATTTFVTVGNSNMAVDGSVTPQVFGVRNPDFGNDVPFAFDIVRMTFKMLCASTLDLSKFGDIIGGLARGVMVRRVDGEWTNLFHFDSNGELKTLCGTDLDIEPGVGNQQDGLTARLTFGSQSKMGAVIRIGQGEDVQVLIQDDISSIVEFRIFMQGSRVSQ